MNQILRLTLALGLLNLSLVVWAEVPGSINYQGRLTDLNGAPLVNETNNAADGQIDLTFRLYDALTGGTEVWGQTNLDVAVYNGLFSELLSGLNETNVPASGQVSRWLEVEVAASGVTNTLSPRKEIVSVAYALQAGNANTLNGYNAAGIVTTASNIFTNIFMSSPAGGITTTDISNWTATAEGALLATNNLADLTDPAAARTNLGLGSAATNNAEAFLAPDGNGSQLTGITAAQVGALSINGGVVNGSLQLPLGELSVGYASVTNGGGVATGGAITTNGNYRTHTFTNSGTFTVSGGTLICDVLVVAGGGGGGNGFCGGGGGAGGVVFTSGYYAAIGTYPLAVGNGGAGGQAENPAGKGTNGADSSFADIMAFGGGGGGAGGDGCGGGTDYNDGLDGGSGGGAGGEMGQEAGLGGLGATDQGYAGGSASLSGPLYGGGGGGAASEVGVDGTSTTPGSGGNGINVWGTIYGGGGGSGGSFDACADGAPGGTGGGGNGGQMGAGSEAANGQNGSTNKGGGGGGGGGAACGAGNECSQGSGGNGGSGIVIVRYPISGYTPVAGVTISSKGITQAGGSATNIFLGKVGIGTSIPGEQLHVGGNVKVDGTNIVAAVTLGGETRTNWPTGALMLSNNLSEITGEADKAAARSNLGLGSAVTQALDPMIISNGMVFLDYDTNDFEVVGKIKIHIGNFVRSDGDTMSGSLTMNPSTRIWGTNIINSLAIINETIDNADIAPNASIAGTKVAIATETTRGTVELATSTDTDAGLVVQANDPRLGTGGNGAETDPQVDDDMADNSVPRWDGSALVTGTIFDDGSGNIGLGTAGPLLEKLHVEGGRIVIRNNTAGNRLVWQRTDNSQITGFGSDGYSELQFLANNAERMRITSAGNVGLGTPSPGTKLVVEGGILAGGSGWNSDAGVGFFAYGSGNRGLFQSRDLNGGKSWIFGDGAGDAPPGKFSIVNASDTTVPSLVIDAGGNVGVGTPAPAAKLDVNGSLKASGEVRFTKTGGDLWPNVSPLNPDHKIDGSTLHGGVLASTGGFWSAQMRHKGYDAIRVGASYYGAGGAAQASMTVEGSLYVGLDGPGDGGNWTPVQRGNIKAENGIYAPTKNFQIVHPLNTNFYLYHSSIEGPRLDLIYRGKARLASGVATVSIDAASRMTSGTFGALTKSADVQVWNNASFVRVKAGPVTNGQFTIVSEVPCDDEVSWVVYAERKDLPANFAPQIDEQGNYQPEVSRKNGGFAF